MLEAAPSVISRRVFLAASGALVVGIALEETGAQAAESVKPYLTPDQLDSYLAVEPDGTVVVFYGRIDGGQGLETSIAQMVAEELDVPFDRVRMVLSDTARTVNMGGASGALGVARSGMHLRSCAAEARRLLVAMAEKPLGVAACAFGGHGWRCSHRRRCIEKDQLCRIDRRPLFQRAPDLERPTGQRPGCFRPGQAETARRF
jgi:CO/xanthine dehydrogenase Mo-binding subunit